MDNFVLRTPVAFVIFNRPDCVRKSFAAIQAVKPQELFIIADGPRLDHPDDARLCAKCREIVEDIDWDCIVHRNYSDINLGCGKRPATGFSWVFEHVERAIILEDDCIPSASFFRFCQEMLEKYKSDSRVYSICGMNYGFTSDNGADYFFSNLFDCWGWATWRRVWKEYDFDLKKFPSYKESKNLIKILLEPAFVNYFNKIFEDIYLKRITDVWDYQFMFLSFLNHAIHICPQKRLVKNIGFNDDATHTKQVNTTGRISCLTSSTEELSFPISYPTICQTDYRIDYQILKEVFLIKTTESLLRNDISEKEIDAIKRFPHILIYGAGIICREVIKFLDRNHIDKFHIVVTNMNGAALSVMGNPVYEIKDYKKNKQRTIVLISANKKYHQEMLANLKRYSFENFFIMAF